MKKPIKLPFGLNENNILVHIADVERGKICNCICPSCRSPLIASKGAKKQPHFKHAVVNECKGGFESAIHLAAKQLIMERKQITVSKYISIVSAKDSRGRKYTEAEILVKDGVIVHFDSVQEEAELHGMKADILAKKGDTPLIIEIFYRHKVDDQKRMKIAESNVSAIEINLSDLTPEDDNVKDWEAFWLYINDPKNVQWLYNAKADNVDRDLEKQVAKKIQAQEEKYKLEEIEKQRQEQKEKEQLLFALDNLKALSSEEHITHLKQNAEMHPLRKYYTQYFPLSWHELPDFVNVEVPNGDWIFGCDRRIWQTVVYGSFIWEKERSFSVKKINDWLQNVVGCKVPSSVKSVAIYGRRYPRLVPAHIYASLPSSWGTLRAYFNHLCGLGMLEFSGDDYHNPGNDWFRVINKNLNILSKS